MELSYWGYETTLHTTAMDTYGTTTYFPLHGVETVEEADAVPFPDPDWFDYSAVREVCEKIRIRPLSWDMRGLSRW